MAVRRLNHTNRKRIARRDARVALTQPAGMPPSFEAAINLDPYRLPAEALVFVEARRQATMMRFPFGTVGHPNAPADRTLGLFETADGVLFRVLVTSTHAPCGLLLAEAEHLSPVAAESGLGIRIPLLPVQPADGLDEASWKLDFSNGPLLLVNRRVRDWRALVSSPAFQALAYPAILRQVLHRVVEEGWGDLSDTSDWRARWRLLARSIEPGAEEPEGDEQDPEAVGTWLDDVLLAFCRRLRLFRKLGEALEEVV